MTMQRIGGVAALACAATYLFGFALLVTVMAEMGFGTNEIASATVVSATVENPALMITWNTVIYIVNAIGADVARRRIGKPAEAHITGVGYDLDGLWSDLDHTGAGRGYDRECCHRTGDGFSAD